jgi:hypothetical protein
MNWRKSRCSNPNGACMEVANWRTSNYSLASQNCAEIGSWRKSEASKHANGCVETGHGPAVIGVRDTKQAHLGDARTVLEFSPAAWREFTATLVSNSGRE